MRGSATLTMLSSRSSVSAFTAGSPPPRPPRAGSATVNSVPSPGADSTVISPACCSTMLARHRQPEPGAVLIFLGGEERIEDVRQDVRRECRRRYPCTRTTPCSVAGSNSGRDLQACRPWAWPRAAFTISTSITCWIWLPSHSTGGRSVGQALHQFDALHLQLVLHQQDGAMHDGVQVVAARDGSAPGARTSAGS